MKVLCILNSQRFSGAENVVCQIIHAMRSEKDIEIAYCSRDGEIREALQERGVSFIPVRNVSVKELRRVISEFQPDVIHAHDMFAGFYAALACGKIPLISHIHNNAFNARRISPKSIAYLFAGRKAKHIFWVSESAYRGYIFHKLFRSKSEILYNAISIDALYAKMSADTKAYHYDIVYVGRLTYQKHPERLMKVFQAIIKRLPDVKIAVAGAGDMEQATRALARDMQLSNNVTFLGFCSNPLKLMHDAKVMVMTSRWEGTPMCVLEAMSLGLPIVSTPTDGVKDLIDNGVTGFLSEQDDELAEKAAKIVSDPSLRKKMSEASRKAAYGINDMEAYMNKIRKQYRSCAAK